MAKRPSNSLVIMLCLDSLIQSAHKHDFFPALVLAVVSRFLPLKQVVNSKFLSLRSLALMFVPAALHNCKTSGL
jgi:hypothetical protein